MGKRNKTISIEENLFMKLNLEKNSSKLIEDLLKQYYNKKQFEDLEEEEINIKLKEIEIMEEAKKKIERLKGVRND